MKSLSRFMVATALTLSLTVVAFGGDIQMPGEIPPPPPAPVPCGTNDTEVPGVVPDPVTAALLTLIENVMPIL